MEIEKTFSSSFKFIWLAKMRQFFRRSIFLYALCSVAIAYQLQSLPLEPIRNQPLPMIWLGVFILLLTLIGGALLLATFMQSRSQAGHVAIFSDSTILVRDGRSTDYVDRGWELIQFVDDTPTYFALVIRERPRFEWFLHKSRLQPDEELQFRNWFSAHGKLNKTPTAG